jgi:hypothetical protein
METRTEEQKEKKERKGWLHITQQRRRKCIYLPWVTKRGFLRLLYISVCVEKSGICSRSSGGGSCENWNIAFQKFVLEEHNGWMGCIMGSERLVTLGARRKRRDDRLLETHCCRRCSRALNQKPMNLFAMRKRTQKKRTGAYITVWRGVYFLFFTLSSSPRGYTYIYALSSPLLCTPRN